MADTDSANALLLSILGTSDAGEIPKRLFVIIVAVIAVAPRMPFDPPCPWSIGGNLSNPFRKCVLLLVFQYFLRHVLHFSFFFQRVSSALEGILRSFMGLLTPYLLRGYLKNCINIPSGAGHGLQVWVLANACLSFLSVALLFYTGDKRLWIFKKTADLISIIPVLRTLQWYNAVTTGQARYPGRGPLLSQVLALCEYCAAGFHLVDIISKLASFASLIDLSGSTKHPILKAFYAGSHYMEYLRVLCHSIFLNYIDEMQSFQATASDNDSEENPASPNDEDRVTLLSLRKSRI